MNWITHIMLAQTGGSSPLPEVSRAELVVWILCAGGVLWIINQAMPVVDRLRGRKAAQSIQVSPQPLSVQEYSAPVTQKEFFDYKKDQELKELRTQLDIKTQFSELNASRERTQENIHKHLEAMRSDIKEQIVALDERYYERFTEGNNRMNKHGEDIAALRASMNKGGKP